MSFTLNKLTNCLKEKLPRWVVRYLQLIYDFIVKNKVMRLTIYITVIFSVFQIHSLNMEVDDLRAELFAAKKINNDLISNVISSKSDFDDLDIAIVYKLKRGKRFIPIYVNKKYEDLFLIDRDRTEYIGRLDSYTHTSKNSSIYNFNDSVVAKTGKAFLGYEPAELTNGKHTDSLIAFKTRRIKKKDTLIKCVFIYKE